MFKSLYSGLVWSGLVFYSYGLNLSFKAILSYYFLSYGLLLRFKESGLNMA